MTRCSPTQNTIYCSQDWVNKYSFWTQIVQSWLLVLGGVNHPAHEQQSICHLVVYEEEKWFVYKEGPG